MNQHTLRVPLSDDGRHGINITFRYERVGEGVRVELDDFATDWGDFTSHAAGCYDSRNRIWTAADGFRIDAVTAENRAMRICVAYAAMT